ncbi:MAG: LysR family transcriptional regulator [Gemmobacter sp.]
MVRYTLDQLQAFLTVVRLGGVGKAAQALNLTQPAVTARIRNLEQAIGAPLFERGAGGMRLTKRGELLVGYAEAHDRLARNIQRDVMDPAGVEGRLRLGVSETIAQSWLPALITRLHQHYPRLEIEFNVDVSVVLRAALLARKIDLAILLGPVSDHSVDNVELPGFTLQWYAAAAAPVPDDPADYLRKPVLSYARSTRPYRELKAELQKRHGERVAIFPSSSLSACFRLVASDLGVAALPEALAREWVETGRLRAFDPGWRPSPLHFTASFLAEGRRHVEEQAARIACEVANEFAST